MLKRTLGILTFLLTASAWAKIGVMPVQQFEIDRLQGKWFEIGAIPAAAKHRCSRRTTVEFDAQKDGTWRVLIACETADQEQASFEGRVMVDDKTTNSRLKFTFNKTGEWIFIGAHDRWIVDHASDHSWIVFGAPDHEDAWILSKSAQLESTDLLQIQRRLHAQGYDTCKIAMTPQRGGFDRPAPLCDAVGMTADPGALSDILSGEAMFSKFHAAVVATEMSDLLRAEGPFTLFVPTDDAIAKLPNGQWESLMASPKLMKRLILNHLVLTDLKSGRIEEAGKVHTAFGSEFEYQRINGQAFVGGSRLVRTDILARNGVLHAIDTVLATPFLE